MADDVQSLDVLPIEAAACKFRVYMYVDDQDSFMTSRASNS